MRKEISRESRGIEDSATDPASRKRWAGGVRVCPGSCHHPRRAAACCCGGDGKAGGCLRSARVNDMISSCNSFPLGPLDRWVCMWLKRGRRGGKAVNDKQNQNWAFHVFPGVSHLHESHLHDVGMEIMENATTEARGHVGATAWHTQHAVPGACVNEKYKGSLA